MNQRFTGGKIPLLTAIFVLLCTNVFAQHQPMRLTAGDAVDMAIRNNLTLETSRVSVETKRRASALSWNQFIPSVTVAGSLLRDNEQGSTTIAGLAPVEWDSRFGLFGLSQSDFELSTPAGTFYNWVMPYSQTINLPQWHVAGTIQASLTISAAMFEGMKLLRLDYEGGLISYEKAKAQLERDVRKLYHSILLMQENVALLQGSFANMERQVEIARANYNAGLAPELTMLQAQVGMENMRPTIYQTENGLKLLMAQFAMFLGLDYDTPFELVSIESGADFIPLDIAELISGAATGRPEIQELRQNILLLESRRRAQLLTLAPALSLSWSGASLFTKDPWNDPWFNSSDDWRNSGSLTISLGWRLNSLIPFSTDFQAIRNTEDQIRTANIGLAQLVRGTEVEIYNTVLSLERIRTSLEALQQTVSLAERSYRLTEQAYQAGLQDYFQVQNAQQSLSQARVQLLEQQFNYLNGLIDLEYSIGVPFGALSSKGSNQ
jgi:outer membrane protein TolC